MASVTSLTAEKIQEMLSGYDNVELSQQEILALVGQLFIATQSHTAALTEFQESVVPLLREDMAASSIRVSELNDTLLPNLQADLAAANLQLENITTVDIPSLQESLANEIVNTADMPKVYIQPEQPTNPDDDDRYLVVGDTWVDDDANNTRYMWDGSTWSTYSLDIPDLSLTVRKFKTNTHLLY